MRFSEWHEHLQKQQERLTVIVFGEVTETISTKEGGIITVTLGKDKYQAEVDGQGYAPNKLRPLYTNNKEEFDGLLEAITSQVESMVSLTNIVLASISEEAVSGAVIERMKGEQISGEPADLVESMVEKKMKNLLEDIGVAPFGIFKDFNLRVDIAGGCLTLGEAGLEWKNIHGRLHLNGDIVSISNIEDGMYFLANFELIRDKVLNLIRQIKAIS